jgi:hypothetical protein
MPVPIKIIITHDTDYLDAVQFPPPHAGILILRFFMQKTNKELIQAVQAALTLLAGRALTDQVWIIEPDRIYLAL